MAKKKTSTYTHLKGKLKNVITRLFGNKNYKKIIILGKQRTGSTLLASLLRAHFQIEIGGEPFMHLKDKLTETIWDDTFGRKLPWLKYAGCKLFYHHPEDSEDRQVWDYVRNDESISIIHIKRNNLLKTYISKLIAEKTGAWNSSYVENDSIDKRVFVDIELCISSLKKSVEWEGQYCKAMFPNHSYIEFTYEELIMNLQKSSNKLMSFLNVKPIKAQSGLKKQNPETLKQLVTNYEDLVESLKKTEFDYLIN